MSDGFLLGTTTTTTAAAAALINEEENRGFRSQAGGFQTPLIHIYTVQSQFNSRVPRSLYGVVHNMLQHWQRKDQAQPTWRKFGSKESTSTTLFVQRRSEPCYRLPVCASE